MDTSSLPSFLAEAIKNPEEKPVKKSRFKKIWIALLGGGLFVVVLVAAFLIVQDDEAQYATTEIRRGGLVQTVEVTGELEPLTEADLAFGVSGTISNLFFQIGDSVIEGDVLAFLDADELQANLERANQVYESARAKLNQVLANVTAEEVVEAEAAVTSSEANLTAANADLEWTLATNATTIREAEIALSDARALYDHLDEENAEELRQVYEDYIEVLSAAIIEVRSALSDADGILGVENMLSNNDIESVLGANDLQTVTDATLAYRSAADLRDEAEDAFLALSSFSTNTEIESAAALVSSALSEVSVTLLYTRRALDSTRTTSSTLTIDDLEAKKTMIDAAREAIQADINALSAHDQRIRDLKIEHANSEAESYDDYLAAQQSLITAQTNSQSNESNAKSTVSIRTAELAQARATLARVVADPRKVDTASYEADVALAFAELEAAEARFKQTEILAPITGIVTDLAFDEGEYVLSGETVIQLETDAEAFRVRALVPESDIAKLAIGNRGEIMFDAYGEDVRLAGTVVAIDPAQQAVEGVVFYEIEVVLDDLASVPLKSGMSADIAIRASEREDVLFLPSRAVLESEGKRFVRVLGEDGYEERFVSIGIRGDGGYLEILEGIEEGEVIITSILD